MRKLLITLSILPAILFMILAVSVSHESGEGKIDVAVSVPPLREVVERIGGDRVRVTTLLPENLNPHVYEPNIEIMRKLSQSEVYVHFGTLEFEKGIAEKLPSLNQNITVVNASEGIVLEDDPHVWISLKNAKIIAENVFRALSSIDPENREFYERNKENYLREIGELEKWNEKFFSEREDGMVLVYHPILSYFSRDYGFEQISVEKEGKEPGLKDLMELKRLVEERDLKTIIVPLQHRSDELETLCKELGVTPLYVNPLSENYLESLQQISKAVQESMK